MLSSMNDPALALLRFLALAPDLAKAFARDHEALSTKSAVHAVMRDGREYVVVEGGEAFVVERTGLRDEIGAEVIVFKSAELPVLVTDNQIAEQRRLFERFGEVAKAAQEGRLRTVAGLRMSLVPEIVQSYLNKPPDEQRQWIEFDATAAEWDAFIEALRSIPEPEQSFIWSFYVMHPHADVVSRRHPSRPPRGSA